MKFINDVIDSITSSNNRIFSKKKFSNEVTHKNNKL